MVIRFSTFIVLRYTFALSLLVLLLVNLLGDGKTALAMLFATVGWLSFLASGVVLATKRVLCPKCQEKWIPATMAKENQGRCHYCAG